MNSLNIIQFNMKKKEMLKSIGMLSTKALAQNKLWKARLSPKNNKGENKEESNISYFN